MSDVGTTRVDVVLVGAGIMSATLGALLRRLEPDWSITVIERLDAVGRRKQQPVAQRRHRSLRAVRAELHPAAPRRIDRHHQSGDHQRAVPGDPAVLGLRRRERHPDRSQLPQPRPACELRARGRARRLLAAAPAALAGNPLFARTELIDDPDEFARRLPLMAAKRDFSEPVALNWAADGTDVDFGSLSKQLLGYCVRNGATALFGHEVRNLTRQSDGSWTLLVANRRTARKAKAECQIRLSRRRWRHVAALTEVRHQRSKRLRRLPDRRPVPAYRRAGVGGRAPGQGVRRSRAGGTAARRAAS